MKRRDLLRGSAAILAGAFATAAVGCDRGSDAKQNQPTHQATEKLVNNQAPSENKISEARPQFEPAPVVFTGTRLGFLRGGKGPVGLARDANLVVFDRKDWTVVATIELESAHGIGALDDDSIVVFEDTPRRRVSVVSDKQTTAVSYAGSLAADNNRRSRVFSSSKSGHVVLAADTSPPQIELVKLADGEAAAVSDIKLRTGTNFDTLAVLADNSMLHYESGKLTQVEFAGKEASFATDVSLNHVVAGPTADTVWASQHGGGLHLMTLTDPMKIRASAPGWVYHLASSGKRVAAIVIEESGGSITKADLVVWDSAAKELWRQDIPEMTSPLNRLAAHWVVASETQIVVGTMNAFKVYDAATGKNVKP